MIISYSGDGQPEVGYCEIFSLSQNILPTEIPSSTQVTTQNPRGIQEKSKAQLESGSKQWAGNASKLLCIPSAGGKPVPKSKIQKADVSQPTGDFLELASSYEKP